MLEAAAAALGGHNFGVLLPWWDMLFGTANFELRYDPTGVRDQVEQGRDYGRGLLGAAVAGREAAGRARLSGTRAHGRPCDFGLIIVGDEILSGKRADKHLPKVIELLAARGLQLAWAEYVGDAPERITATLRRAFASGDMVFSCGGIGATPDDHTRQCAAQALGVPLELHPQAEALIRERMQDIAREQGDGLRARSPRQHPPPEHGRVPAGRAAHSQPVQQDPGLQRGRRAFRARAFR